MHHHRFCSDTQTEGRGEYLPDGLRFVFPANPASMQRGIPTAFAAPMLEGLLVKGGSYNYVWPYAEGREMGQSVEPLFKSVPEAALKDQHLYEYLALIDAIRLGNQREVGLASDHLKSRMFAK